MPYIDSTRREQLVPYAEVYQVPKAAGELNYIFTQYCVDYLHREGTSYQTINDCLGALEGAKQEFYRRVAAPYEDDAKERNGDVYK